MGDIDVFIPEIFTAISSGEVGRVELLLNLGVPIDSVTPSDGDRNEEVMTTLQFAVMMADVSIVRCLLEKGADPNSPKNWTAVHMAIRQQNLEMVRLFVEHGARLDMADPDHDHTTPLIWAVKTGNEAITTLVLESGCNVNFQNDFGLTPLNVAIISGGCHLVPLLLQYGAIPLYSENGKIDTLSLASKQADISPDTLMMLFSKVCSKMSQERYLQSIRNVVKNLCSRNDCDTAIKILEILSEKVSTTLKSRSNNAQEGEDEEKNEATNQINEREYEITMSDILDSAAKMKNIPVLKWIMQSPLVSQGLSIETSHRLLITRDELPVLELILSSPRFPNTFKKFHFLARHYNVGMGHMSNYGALLQTDTDEGRLAHLQSALPPRLLRNNDLPKLKLLYATGVNLECLREHVSRELQQNANQEISEIMKWVLSVLGNPRSLQSFCVVNIRQSLGHPLLQNVPKLPVPQSIQNKLLLRECDAAVL